MVSNFLYDKNGDVNTILVGFLGSSAGKKNPPAMQETQV